MPLLSRAREVTPLAGFQSDAAVPETVTDAGVLGTSVASVGAAEPLDASVLVGVGDMEDMVVVMVVGRGECGEGGAERSGRPLKRRVLA